MSDTSLGGQSGERDLLCGFLDWYRAIVARKVEDLTLEQACRVMTPSGLTPLGIVSHLTDVERIWFRWRFAGDDVSVPEGPRFELEADDTVPSVVARYRSEVEHASAITARAPLDQLSVREAHFYGRVSLRWILVHLIEETARHAGHLDLMREVIDGRTGD